MMVSVEIFATAARRRVRGLRRGRRIFGHWLVLPTGAAWPAWCHLAGGLSPTLIVTQTTARARLANRHGADVLASSQNHPRVTAFQPYERPLGGEWRFRRIIVQKRASEIAGGADIGFFECVSWVQAGRGGGRLSRECPDQM
jgi:hypothetical protein